MIKISDGNDKIGKCPNVSTPPGSTCNGMCKGCYALNIYRRYGTVRTAWDNNLLLLKKNRKRFFREIGVYLTYAKRRFFRWHVSGDIADQDYLENMKRLARENPDIRFLAFTKRYELTYRNIPKNLSIVMSAWPGKPLPRKNLPIAFMQDGTETRVKNAMECVGSCEDCGLCWYLKELRKNVVFYKH